MKVTKEPKKYALSINGIVNIEENGDIYVKEEFIGNNKILADAIMAIAKEKTNQ